MIYLVTFTIFLTMILFLAVGVIVANKKIKGSCGGIQTVGNDGEIVTSCPICSGANKVSECKNK